MKRYVKYIVTLVVALMAVACTFTDIDQIVTPTVSGGAGFSIVSRVISYTDYDVATRAPKDPAENNITMADYVIMNNDYRCIFYAHSSNTVLTLDKTALADQFADMPDSLTGGLVDGKYPKLTNCSVYVIANYPEVKAAVDAEGVIGQGLGFFQAIKSDVKGVTLPTSGLPMIGVHGKGANVDFSTPELKNITAGTTFVANLICLYAKIAFTIDVEAIQTTPNKPTFTLESFAVSNLAKTVDMWPGQEEGDDETETADTTEVYSETFSGDLTGNLTTIHGGTPITFYCYLPERFLKDGDASAFTYPFGMGSSILEEDNEEDKEKKEYKKYLQRYKPLLAQGYTKYDKTGDKTADREATYVTLNGVYTTHQGHSYDVSYDIYVGNNNYSNFDIVRNRQYNNSVTIKGIDTSHNNNSTELDAVSVDHRVNVTRTQPVIINLRRETLLDSHFEVRPMRIRKNKNYTSDAQYVKVSVDQPWVRLERSFGNTSATTLDSNASKSDTYIDLDNGSNGKRKYFTTNLVTETLAADSVVIVPINEANQTVWIYVDENLDNPGDGVRSATLAVTSYKDENCTQRVQVDGNDLEPIVYTLNQHELFKITTNGRTYYIEYEEEYLHNFDAEDAFVENEKPTTQIQGMPWGLDSVQLSNEHYSFNISLTPNVDWGKYETTAPRPCYDFYTWQQDSVVLKNADIAQTDERSHDIKFAGQHFTSKIYDNSNGKVRILTMAQQANGAVEYCYNRNKRNSDGSIAEVKWYLPSADELEDFIVPAYSSFKEFQDNYYWTSQPAYIKNMFYYEYQPSRWSNNKDVEAPIVYDDNTAYARATKIARKDGSFVPTKSGLDSIPTPYIDNRSKNGKGNQPNLAYIYQMHQYKYYYKNFSLKEEYGPDRTGVADAIAKGIDATNGDYDDSYNGNYIHMGHLYNMIQKTDDGEHGYHERTRNNRVRCVRVAPGN